MDDLSLMEKASLGDVIAVAIFVLGALGSIARHWWNQHHARINDLEARTQKIEREMPTKVSLQHLSDATDVLRRDILQSNHELREELQGTNRRLDTLIFKSIDDK